MLYLDTSVLVTALTPEAGTDQVRAWLARHDDDDLRISDWVTTEFSAALSMKIRIGDLAADRRAVTSQVFHDLATQSLGRLPIERAHYLTAAQLCEDTTSGLRAGDALHLAVASSAGATVCTLDKGMVKAGKRGKVPIILVR